MKRVLLLTLCAVSLGGCRQAALERNEMADDGFCRRTITERNDNRPSAYQECRANMMAYRDQQIASRSRHMTLDVNRY